MNGSADYVYELAFLPYVLTADRHVLRETRLIDVRWMSRIESQNLRFDPLQVLAQIVDVNSFQSMYDR